MSDRYEKLHSNSGYISIAGMGDKIKEARNNLKMSRIKAASYCDVSENTFFRWENDGTRNIKEESYNKLVDILNGECSD